MPFVSVIIPVYNVEKYLRQCVDSVLSQNLDNIEIILVDDGSKDKSVEICDEYEKKHKEIKVIHQENGGASSARNKGIQVAKGEYLIFLDSDDWWNPEINVKEIFDEVKLNRDIDMFLFTSYDYVEGQGLFKRNEHNYLKNVRTDCVLNFYQDLLNHGNLEVHVATKIIKRDFLEDNKLYFCEGMLGEDNEWMLRLLRNLKSVHILDNPLYIYRTQRQGSVTQSIKKKNIEDLLRIVDKSIVFFQGDSRLEYLKNLELCYASYLWFSALGLCSKLERKEQKQIRPFFMKTRMVCKYSNSPKTKLCNMIFKLFGFDITMLVLGAYINAKEKYNINKKRLI